MENQGTSNASLSSTSEASPPENVSELCKKLHVATANLVRQSNKLPMLGDGHELYSSFADYAEFMRVQRNRAIIMLRRLTNYQGRLNESALNDGMGPLIGFCDALVDRAAIALDEHQRSLTRDRIKARQISLGAEPILRSATSTIVASASNSQIVKPGSAADAFSRNAHRGGTFRDGGGRFAVFSTHSEMMTENTAKKGVGNATINATAANVGPAQTILTLPREPSGILACCAPVPPIVRIEQAALHKIICHARDLPLEHSVVSSVQSATPARERNADEVLGEFDANRITAQRAKLELRIDLSRAYKSLLTMTTTDETAMLDNDNRNNKNRQRGDGGAEGTAPRGTMRKLIEIANRWEHLKETNNKRTDEEEGRTGKESVSNNELKKLLTMNRRMSAIRTVVLIDDEEEDNDGEQRGNGEEVREPVPPYSNFDASKII
ncbi:hypothetical protein niasHT_037986 [Heterodera trifolii]|uniref:Exosome-associated factor Rrp6 N-terminal domain-containing protein n=1 Tax=Heterodera trifolii TaxID=157864 RepID=A0ABD2HPX8_9BILA